MTAATHPPRYLVRYYTSDGAKLNTSAIPVFRPVKIGDYIPIRAGLWAKIIQKL